MNNGVEQLADSATSFSQESVNGSWKAETSGLSWADSSFLSSITSVGALTLLVELKVRHMASVQENVQQLK